jgi:hypothetical protein
MWWRLDKGLSLVFSSHFNYFNHFISKARIISFKSLMKGWVKSVQKDSANTVHWQTILVIGLSFAVLLVVLILKVGDYSSVVVMKITPGANALRIVCRFTIF